MLQDQEHDERPPQASNVGENNEAGEGLGPLVLHVAGEPSEFETLASQLEAHGAQQERDSNRLAEHCLDDPSARIVVVYPNPVTVLARRLDAGGALEESIRRWREETGGLLALFRRDRRRVTLVDGHAALAAPALFFQLLGSRLPVEVMGGEDRPAAKSETAGLLHLVADQALRQDDLAAPMMSELEAGSLPLGIAYDVDFDDVVASLAKASATREAGTETDAEALDRAIDELKEENEILLRQLRGSQEELEVQFLEHRSRKDELNSVRGQVKEARAVARQARLARDSLEAEFSAARHAWRNERKSLTDRLKWSADDLAAIRHSLSWRLTAPLRRVIGLFTGGTKL